MVNNIIFLDDDYKISATMLNDQHIKHMPFFIARILSQHLRDGGIPKGYYTSVERFSIYNQYLRRDTSNYSSLLSYLGILLKEFKHRFDKDHIVSEILDELTGVDLSTLSVYNYYGIQSSSFPLFLGSRYTVYIARHNPEIDIPKTCMSYYKDKHADGEYTKRKKPRWLSNDTTKKPKIQDTVRETVSF